MSIHPTAIVDPAAVIHEDAEVGPWCIVGPGVTLAAGVVLQSSVVIERDTDIGEGTTVGPFGVLGSDPQHKGYRGEPTRLVIGARNLIRENATLNRGTPQGGGVTTLGDDCYLMAGVHLAHDCTVGDNVTLANHVTLAGHGVVEDHVFMGGLAGAHQYCRIGRYAMVGGLAALTKDVIPYGSVWGNHARLGGLNLVGLKRRGYSKDAIRRLLAAYRDLFEGPGAFADRVRQVEQAYADVPEVQEITAFIRAGGHRPLCLPGGD